MLAYLGIRSEPSDKSALLRIGREGHFLGGKNYDMTHEWSSLPKGPTLQLLLERKKIVLAQYSLVYERIASVGTR